MTFLECKEALRAIREQAGMFNAKKAWKELSKEKRSIEQFKQERRILIARSQRERLYSDQSGICPGCEQHFKLIEMEVDHIIALSLGGKNEFRNYRLLCVKCNREKSSKSLPEMSKENGKTVLEQLNIK